MPTTKHEVSEQVVNYEAIEAQLPFAADEEEVVEEAVEETTDIATIEVVTIKIKRTQPKRLINAIVQANSNVEVEEGEDAYVITAPYVKVRRSDVEVVTGSMSDTKWRMLFMNRVGEVSSFTNHEFIIGVPQPTITEEDRRVWTQVNIRLPKDLKEEMELLRSAQILNMSQNEFVAEAVAEYIAMIKRDRV